ncbi:glycosyltransferase involved in cell wall biosynthesis [Rhodoblastus acidophilus]|uniref:glycosyltransferase family 2 protein n=1 Tax=Rhodoblastus acidophilus TaxID=1074 RepID=UPI002225AE75|nr:glycosyltransferase family 2 protein [Rhodoblastus acidophilus]MCW2284369.1 glycosyltransferase involved in cell wall biosynthesis [Rhodoblastus acidophilus]MCW2333153.1 glycosyltransferase involved in cell wall biosynthesis [Rhodoblastus acidophilus]
MVKGYFERADRDFVVGWAFDSDAPDKPLRIEIEVDGEVRWQGDANAHRRDLEEAGVGGGAHGFAVATEVLGALPTSEFSIGVRVAGRDRLLPGAPRLLPGAASPPVAKPAPKPTRIAGNLEDISNTFIRGWAFDHGRPNVPVSVDLFVDGAFIARTDADQFRRDLRDAGLGDGKCAFYFVTPFNLRDGASHRIQVLPSNLGGDLGGSPQDRSLHAVAPLHDVTHFQSKLSAMIEEVRRNVSQLQSEASHISSAGKAVSFYRQWYDAHVAMTVQRRHEILQSIVSLPRLPLISILMPAYNTEPRMLRAAIESVRAQLYPHWELCIADDCSTNEETKRVLDEYARLDVRVVVINRERNGHISEATNSALRQATGEYIALMDHDDELTEDALFYMAKAINETGAELLYSDEDKIDTGKVLFEPHFKPAFNYTLLLSYNYICHFVVVKRDLAVKIGGFRTETNGAQDHDFLLRLCEHLKRDKIVHVPRVLYHWRAHQASTALDVGAKDYVIAAAKRALSDHLRATGFPEVTVIPENGYYHVRWPVPAEHPRVSVVIPTRDCADILSLCLVSLLNRTDYDNFEIIIIDNGSVEPATAALFEEACKDSRVRVVSYDRPFNYSAICNFGVEHATGDLLLMMNNDIEVRPGNEDWLKEMVAQVLRPEIGAVGAKLLYPNGKVQHAGVILGLGGRPENPGVAGHSHKYADGHEGGYFNRLVVAQELSACTAACLLIRREVFESVGGFDQISLPVAFNDVDLCLRIREAGWGIVYAPHATLVHHESYSRGEDNTPAKIVRAQREVAYMRRRWGDALDNDPAYSPSLTLAREDFGMDLTRGAGDRTSHRYGTLAN